MNDDKRASSDEPSQRPTVKKAPNAFRTISEVADDLHIPQHVLRFWETKFVQVKPLKRGGGRRYYRPTDIVLLRRIADLLYTQGYTIKGVQRLLREGGGQLAENIPPPDVEERATTIEHAAETGFTPPGNLGVGAGETSQARGSTPDAAAREADGAAETDRLREVLRTVLSELEALRTLLDR